MHINMIHMGQLLFRYRSYVPLVMLAPVLYLASIREKPSRTEALGILAVSITALAFRMFTVGHSPKGTSGRNTNRQLADSLTTTGAYSLSRNPLYVANIILWTSISSFSQSWVAVLLSFVFALAFYFPIILAEEDFLRKKFKEQYSLYISKVPRLLSLHVQYLPSAKKFNWKKVIRKEKNGTLAIAAIYYITQLLNDHHHTQAWLWDQGFALWTLTAALCYYLSVKLISRHTSWLY